MKNIIIDFVNKKNILNHLIGLCKNGYYSKSKNMSRLLFPITILVSHRLSSSVL